MLAAADEPEDLAIPGMNFHAYPEGAQGRFAVMVSKAWRLSFAWREGEAIDVDLEDVH